MSILQMMCKLRFARVLIVMLTIALCIAVIVFQDVYQDYVLFITIVLLCICIFLLYGIFFNSEKRKMYVFYQICVLFLLVCVNRLYSYACLTKVFPWIETVNPGVTIPLFFGLLSLFLGGVKIYQKFHNNFWISGELDDYTEEDGDFRTQRDEKQERASFRNTGNRKDYGMSEKTRIVQAQEKKQPEKECMSVKSPKNILQLAGTCLLFVIILCIAVSIMLYADKLDLQYWGRNPLDKVTVLVTYGGVLLLIALFIGLGVTFLWSFSGYIIRQFTKFAKKLRNDETENKGIPIYVLSVFIVLSLFYVSYSFGEFTIEDFTDFAAEGRYFVWPLILILLFAVFTILVWLVHGVLALLKQIDGKNVHQIFLNIESEVKIAHNCKLILKRLFDFLFKFIFSILSFLAFIPDYVTGMCELLGLQAMDEEDSK